MTHDEWHLTDLEIAVLGALTRPRRDVALYQEVADREGVSRRSVQLALESLHRHGAVIRWDGESARTERGRRAA